MARPLPLYPPSGISIPLYAFCVSVVGTPSESKAQPAGISGWSLMKALKMRPAATVVVAISSSQGPGTDMQIGIGSHAALFSLPWRNDRRSIAHHDSDLARRAHLLRPPSRRAEVIRIARDHQSHSLRAGDAHRMTAADFTHPLAQTAFGIEHQARAVLGDYVAIGFRRPLRPPVTGRDKTAEAGCRANPHRANWKLPATSL